MTFHAHMAELVQHVERAVVPDSGLRREEAPVAIDGHRALVSLVRDVLPEVVGYNPGRGELLPSLQAVEQRPGLVLASLARSYGTVQSLVSPTDAQLIHVQSRHGACWQQIAKHATVALSAWHSADPQSRPRGEQGWAVTAQATALVLALQVLTQDLHHDLTRFGQLEQAAQLHDASPAGLQVVADRVLDIATRGPLPRSDLRPPPRPFRVASPHAVAPAQQRLVELLGRPGTDLHPKDVATIAEFQALIARRTAHVLRQVPTRSSGGHQEVDPHQVAAGLEQYAAAMGAVRAGLARTRSLRPGDPHAALQARQVQAFLATASHQDVLEVAAAVVRATSEVTQALRDKAGDQVRGQRWLVVSENAGPGEIFWVPPRNGPSVRALDQLGVALDHARELAGTVDPATSPTGNRSSRQQPDVGPDIDGLLAAVRSRHHRPASPTHPAALVLAPAAPPSAVAYPPLRPDQIQLLQQVAAGADRREIAADMGVTPAAVHDRIRTAVAQVRGNGDHSVGRAGHVDKPARTAARILQADGALQDVVQARQRVSDLTESIRTGPQFEADLRQARDDLAVARRRLDRTRTKLGADAIGDPGGGTTDRSPSPGAGPTQPGTAGASTRSSTHPQPTSRGREATPRTAPDRDAHAAPGTAPPPATPPPPTRVSAGAPGRAAALGTPNRSRRPGPAR